MSARRAGALSSLLIPVVEALRSNSKRSGEGDALRAFGELARLKIPARGVLAPTEDELYQAIERVATTHLQLGGVRKALGSALTAVEPFATRDEIADAVNHMCTVLDLAYFNAGLAFGITYVDLRSIRTE